MFFTCIGRALFLYTELIVYFVCDSASEFWSDGLYFLFGVFLPYHASCFSELVIFRNLYHVFLASVGAFSGSFLILF